MIDIGLLFQKMLMLLLMMCVGFLAGKTKVMTSESNHSLSVLINKITTPCMVLYSAVCNEHALTNAQVLQLIGLAAASYVILMVLAKIVVAIIRPERASRGLYEFVMIFSNLGFIGIPVISAVYGTSAVFYISIFIMVFFFMLYTYGVCLIQEISIKNANFRQMLSPMMIASMLSIILYLCNVRLPVLVTDAMNSISQICTPGAMLLIGSTLAGIPLKGLFSNWRLFVVAAAKLFLAPIVINLVMRLVIRDELILGVVTLVAAMPVASNMSLLAAQYGKDEDFAAIVTFLTTVCSVLTIPLVAMLLL